VRKSDLLAELTDVLSGGVSQDLWLLSVGFFLVLVWKITPEVCTSILRVDSPCAMKKAMISNAKNVIEYSFIGCWFGVTH